MSQQINLLDATLLPPRDWCTGAQVFGLAVLLSSAVGAHALYESWALKRLLAAAPAPAALAEDAPSTPDADAATQQLQRNRALLGAVSGLTDLPTDNARRIQALTAALPQSVWLREVVFSGARGVRIEGGTLEPQALAALSERLGATEAFHDQPLRVFSLAPLPDTAEASGAARARPAYGFVLSSLDNPGSATP